MTDTAQILASGGGSDLDSRASRPVETWRQWEMTITEAFCRMNIDESVRQRPFNGELETRDYRGLRISTVKAAPHQAIRTPDMVERKEDFFVGLVIDGRGEVRQGGRSALLANGAFTVVDGSRPFAFSFPSQVQQLIIRVPRQVFLARIPEQRIERVLGATLPGGAGVSGLASAVFQQAALIPQPADPTMAETMSLSMLDMLVTALQGISDGLTETEMAHQQDLRRIQNHLIAHLSDPGWTLKQTGEELGMSPRYIHQVFSNTGLTPASWWTRIRLDYAHQLLRSGGVTGQEASERAGFKDPAHFSRAFKKHYGITPGKVRTQAKEARGVIQQ